MRKKVEADQRHKLPCYGTSFQERQKSDLNQEPLGNGTFYELISFWQKVNNIAFVEKMHERQLTKR